MDTYVLLGYFYILCQHKNDLESIMCAEHTTIKISKRDREMLEEAQKVLKNQGLKTLNDIDAVCPRCERIMEGISVKAESWECPHCGYSEKGLSVGATGSFALGAIAGAAAAGLLWYLFKQQE
ncbi:hypothetical protein AKJ37_03550 [candidate division MSBL1 archaeon SCGC-AAA259I09]|uniref:Uncharacterized protein n=1 Tax=candidate division MSBL1 archaeon SCGC-AAA259I09 TaxID=1698267 RepID=A0A133USR6_9EURY|nr:hypothetical protein AKJ37_03550 [candidate division MSBL1 archaeon SCGC-AAA259I09]